MIWITQWLCPKRHCSIALVWNEMESKPEEIEVTGEAFYAEGKLNRHCGLCGGGLHVEHGRTIYRTMAEAIDPLKEQERQNLTALARLAAQRN